MYQRGAIYKLSGAVVKLASINLRKLVFSPTGLINLDFILREDLLLFSSYLPLGVPNWANIYTPSSIEGVTLTVQRGDVVQYRGRRWAVHRGNAGRYRMWAVQRATLGST
jgi:hypothetical protein